MKSIAKAINNLANSISKAFDANNFDFYKRWLDVTILFRQISGSVNVTSTYISKDTEGWFSLNSAEREQLYYVYKAITVNGADPNYTSQDIVFSRVMDNLYANWPSLHNPIQKLIVLKKKSVEDKLNQKYTSSKKVIKFPHTHTES